MEVGSEEDSSRLRRLTAAVAAQPDIPAAVETPEARRQAALTADWVMAHLPRAEVEPTVRLIWWALWHLDRTALEETLGACWELDVPPRTLNYLAVTIRHHANRLGIRMPEWNPTLQDGGGHQEAS